MKICVGRSFQSVVMLDEIRRMNLGVKIEYWCTKNMEILFKDSEFYRKNRNAIYEKCFFKGEDGKHYIVLEDGSYKFNLKENCDVEKFNEEINDLIFTESSDFEPYIMPMEVIAEMPNIKLKSGLSSTIDFLLP